MTKREEFEAALRAYGAACGAVGYDVRYARVLALYDEAEKRVADLELDWNESQNEINSLAARCEELAKRNTDGEEQRLADEQTIRNLTKRYDALAATVERVKAVRRHEHNAAYDLAADLDAALAPQRETE